MLSSNIFKKLLRLTHSVLVKNRISKSYSYFQNVEECNLISSQLRENYKKVEENGLIIPFYKKALLYYDKNAIQDCFGEYSYLQLYTKAKSLSIQVSNICGSASSSNVIYICPNNVLTIMSQWSCWMSGQIPIPFNPEYMSETLESLTLDLKPKLIITTPTYEALLKYFSEKFDIAYIIIDHTFMRTEDVSLSQFKKLFLVSNGSFILEGIPNNDYYTNSLALMLHYTHGYTVNSKYSKITHNCIKENLKTNFEHFKCNPFDVLYQFFSVNSVFEMFCLDSGQKIFMFDTYNTQHAWSTICNATYFSKSQVNIFASLPKIYYLILIEFERNFSNIKYNVNIKNYLQKYFRFVVYCNDISTVTIISNRWKEITGTSLHVICYNKFNKIDQTCFNAPDTSIIIN